MIVRNINKNDFDQLQKIKSINGLEILNNRLERQMKGDVNFLVLEDNGEIKCFLLLKWKGRKTHPEYPDIEDLFTKESERGKGYASILISECEKMAREKGFNKIGLAVNPDENCPAHRLYKKLGFMNLGEKPYVDAIYNGVEDWCVDMVKNIK